LLRLDQTRLSPCKFPPSADSERIAGDFVEAIGHEPIVLNPSAKKNAKRESTKMAAPDDRASEAAYAGVAADLDRPRRFGAGCVG
jgi:hypothetical protein